MDPVPYAAGGAVPDRRHKSFKLTRHPGDDATLVPRIFVGVIIGLLVAGAVVALLVISIPATLMPKRSELEIKQLNDLATSFEVLAADRAKSQQLQALPDCAGRKFYEQAFTHRILSNELLSKVVSLAGGDYNAVSDPTGSRSAVILEAENCSYTAPRAHELLGTMELSGRDRCVLVTFNSRNWDNYDHRGVIVLWSFGQTGWMTFEEARNEWGITEQEWADPAGKLFGKKAPFQHTYE